VYTPHYLRTSSATLQARRNREGGSSFAEASQREIRGTGTGNLILMVPIIIIIIIIIRRRSNQSAQSNSVSYSYVLLAAMQR